MLWTILFSVPFMLAIGFAIGAAAEAGRTFREGGGLVLVLLSVAALVASALFGVLASLLPVLLAFYVARVAAICFGFAIGVWFGPSFRRRWRRLTLNW